MERIFYVSVVIIIAIVTILQITVSNTIDPLQNLTREEYRQSYSDCVINSTCNLYLGPGTVHLCITECMRSKITNSTDGNKYHHPLIIGSTTNAFIYRNGTNI